MTTVARRDPADKAKIDAIEKKLLANPEIAKLIDDLGTSTTDANDLVRGMLQASITRGLNAEMDATWATSLVIGKAKLLLEQIITATAPTRKPWILTTGRSPLMYREIGLEHSCRLWFLKVLGA